MRFEFFSDTNLQLFCWALLDREVPSVTVPATRTVLVADEYAADWLYDEARALSGECS
jgi:hypothetical protein